MNDHTVTGSHAEIGERTSELRDPLGQGGVIEPLGWSDESETSGVTFGRTDNQMRQEVGTPPDHRASAEESTWACRWRWVVTAEDPRP